ncbi:MAG: 4-hydroxy-tetrahydrodipicolinate synthase [delta proteobacterium ML8_F1]|nr:MAG: 4-hydroxy-tetrahydrodipicolinate synthase [delta proteobacterium ML8_F1]
MELFTGSGVALVTPFTEDLQVDYSKFEALIGFHLKHQTDALIVCGTTGEAPTISDDEKLKLFELAVKTVQGRVPIIAGTGSNDTRHVIEMSKKAQALGVDALLVVTPYYNKSSQAGLVAHFTAIADAVDIPIILYNVPSRTGINIEPSTVQVLAGHPNIAALKEASGNISQIVEMARIIPEGFRLYSGNDDHVVPLLSVGGHGVITVIGNVVPQMVHDMVAAYLQGDVKKAMALQLKLKPLNDALFTEVNPIPVKTAMNLMGFEVGPMRLPLVPMDPNKEERMVEVLKRFDLL